MKKDDVYWCANNRDWMKYHHKQKGETCQVISAVNAYYFHTGKVISQESKRYKDLVEMAGAVAGPAITIGNVYKKLKLDLPIEGSF